MRPSPYRQRLDARFAAALAEILPGRELTPAQLDKCRAFFDAGEKAARVALAAKLHDRMMELGPLVNPMNAGRLEGADAEFVRQHITSCTHFVDRIMHPEEPWPRLYGSDGEAITGSTRNQPRR